MTGATGPADTAEERARLRRRELRETISRAALDLVLERGLDAVTVDEIARAANVSRRTFFNYFPSKAAACVPANFHTDRGAVDLLLTDRSVPTMQAVARLLWQNVSLAHRTTADFSRFHDLWRTEPSIRPDVHAVLGRAERELARLVARREGLPADAPQPAAVAAAAIAVLRVAVEQWRADETPDLLELRIRECFGAVSDAVTGAVT